MRLVHSCVPVSDLELAIKFYHDMFGAEVVKRREVPSSNVELALVRTRGSDHLIELVCAKGGGLPKGEQFRHVCFEVQGIDEVVASLKAKGASVGIEPTSIPKARYAFIRDPDGNWIELLDYS